MHIDPIHARQVALARLLTGGAARRIDTHASEQIVWPECASRPYGVGAGTLLVMMYLRSSLPHADSHSRDSTPSRD
jgi:hypothetical protein